jgi:hypothetical protein
MRLLGVMAVEAILAPQAIAAELIDDIVIADNNVGPYTITLAPDTTFDFTSASDLNDGANAMPVIAGDITIIGNGDTIERTGSTERIFRDDSTGCFRERFQWNLRWRDHFWSAWASCGNISHPSGRRHRLCQFARRTLW